VVAATGDDAFWGNLKRVIELGQPVADALHQLEGDNPRLSQLLAVWVTLIDHADAFDADHDHTGDMRVSPVFRRRFAIHYQPEWLAAYSLDPIHAKPFGGGGAWKLALALRDVPVPTAPNGAPLEFNFGPNNGQRIVKESDLLSCVVALVGADQRAAVRAELSQLKLRGVRGGLAEMLEDSICVAREEGKLAPLIDRISWWEAAADDGYPLVAKAAVKLLSCHATSCASERNWSLWGNVFTKARTNLALERGKKLIAIRHNERKSAASFKSEDEEVMLTLLEEPE
jgi:hypothetical protein